MNHRVELRIEGLYLGEMSLHQFNGTDLTPADHLGHRDRAFLEHDLNLATCMRTLGGHDASGRYRGRVLLSDLVGDYFKLSQSGGAK